MNTLSIQKTPGSYLLVRLVYPFLILAILIIGHISCSSPTNNSGSQAVASETWRISETGTQNYALLEIVKKENGTISCTGNWYYEFFGNNITCKIMQGSVQKDTSFLDFTCTGTASYPPDSSGFVESSNFTLKMSGQFKNGISSGDWLITFSDTEWNEWAPDGVFSGQLENGRGITD